MDRITVYQKPTCTTCRKVYSVLKDSGVDFETVDYYIEPLSKVKLRELLGKMGISARELLRTKEPIYRKLKIGGRNVSDARILDLMVKYPDLIQRPIAEKGNKAILARPAERIRELL
jgi:arsenate reductase